jgi:transposase
VRIKYLNQIRHLGFTAPDELRERLRDVPADQLARTAASLRPDAGTVMHATKLAIRMLGRRVLDLETDSRRLDRLIDELVRRTAPSLLDVHGVGTHTAAILLVAAGDNPHRLHSEAAFAHLCGVAPLPASSGKVVRHRLDPDRNRQANHALWRIVFTRMSSDERTRKYVARRTSDGLTTREVMRVLKRYVAREIYPHLLRAEKIWSDGPGPRMPQHQPAVLRTNRRPITPDNVRHARLHKSSPPPEWPITALPATPTTPLTTQRSFALRLSHES